MCPTLFGGPPKMPTIPTPTVMPQASPTTLATNDQQQQAAASRTSGYISTIMTNPQATGSDRLG